MNVAEHTVPSFSCEDGTASAVMADSLDESDFFFLAYWEKKQKRVGVVNVVRLVTSCTALTGEMEHWSLKKGSRKFTYSELIQ